MTFTVGLGWGIPASSDITFSMTAASPTTMSSAILNHGEAQEAKIIIVGKKYFMNFTLTSF